ncbi:hypothetical protein Acsp06_56580 [Actinomycetospora sp. NBRC 106375]|uniref:hypothetical protein n=1 Tax=Actinomycetospora sp. NBRC 106375 TaxID=3032207 RepID=UPI0024A5B37A|nr:hypothetical protein [Actinomycetospora sp. NBRC 106375]GLZ49473.1 hypothetical protein Acsp06_56580 [Actinomycetospora sp. NBRC 106375]
MPDEAEQTGADSSATTDVTAWAEDGRLLVAGEQAAVDAFIAELAPDRELDLRPYRALSEGVGSLGQSRTGEMAKRYVELGAERWKEVASSGGVSSELRVVARDAKTGKFVANVPAPSLKAVAKVQPEVMIALAAIEMALQSLTETVEEIASNVEDLKRIAETVEIGNLAGLYRVLANARTQVDRTGTISRTTWESLATHEVTAQQSADRLRAYLQRVLKDLPVAKDAGDRSKAAGRLLKEGTLQRTLRLLVLAEQCRLLWRSLKLDQVRVAEPEALDAEAEAAKALLAENAHADRELVAALRQAVEQLTKVGPLDGARLMTRSQMPEQRAALRAQVEEFATSRAQQFDSWAPDQNYKLRDAVREVGQITKRGATVGTDVVRGRVASFGAWLHDTASSGGTSGRHSHPSDERDS